MRVDHPHNRLVALPVSTFLYSPTASLLYGGSISAACYRAGIYLLACYMIGGMVSSGTYAYHTF